MDEHGLRRETIRATLRDGEALAVSPGSSFLYLMGTVPVVDERPCFYLASAQGECLVLPEVNARSLGQPPLPVERYADAQGAAGALARARESLGEVRALAVEDAMRADALLLLQVVMGAGPPSLLSQRLGSMRMVKSAAEIDRLRVAARMADQAVEAAVAALELGVTEREVARVVDAACFFAGADRTGAVAVSFGDHTADPHAHATDRALARGDVVMLDIGAVHQGYVSDITRMAVVQPVPDGFDDVVGIVDAAVQAAMRLGRPGCLAAELDLAARRIIAEGGYDRQFVHRLGHGLGLDGHEPPWVHEHSMTPLRPGMVFTIEPGIYLPSRFGVRLEEAVVVTETGLERLSHLQRVPWRVPG